jgi:hypothetical protein
VLGQAAVRVRLHLVLPVLHQVSDHLVLRQVVHREAHQVRLL